ncbi:hypothetical protein CRYUN_Cryun06bG0077100 [Craigia yunnanensis]
MASGPVVLMATSFAHAVYDSLPLEEEDPPVQVQPEASQSSGVTGSGGEQLGDGGSGGNSGGDGSGVSGTGGGGFPFYNLGMNMGSYPFPGDVFGWSGTATRPSF